jgi:hypothetical protein
MPIPPTEPGTLTAKHLKRRHALTVDADADIRNLDPMHRVLGFLVRDDNAPARQRLRH